MSGPPDLSELFGDDVSAQELAKLQRVADRLLAAGPLPPEPSMSLDHAVMNDARPRPTRLRFRLPMALSAASAAAAAVIAGIVLAGGGSDPAFARTFPLHATKAAASASGAVRISATDRETGNYTIELEVSGLPHLSGKKYYVLGLANDGHYEDSCGTFNVGPGTTTVRMPAAYRLSEYDAWVVSEELPHLPTDPMPPSLLTGSIQS